MITTEVKQYICGAERAIAAQLPRDLAHIAFKYWHVSPDDLVGRVIGQSIEGDIYYDGFKMHVGSGPDGLIFDSAPLSFGAFNDCHYVPYEHMPLFIETSAFCTIMRCAWAKSRDIINEAQWNNLVGRFAIKLMQRHNENTPQYLPIFTDRSADRPIRLVTATPGPIATTPPLS